MAEEQNTATPPRDDHRRLARDPEGRVLAGVCTGLGRFTGIDPVVFRVGFAILTLSHGQGILLYILAAVLMPATPGESSLAERLFKRWFDAAAVLSILGALLCVGLAGSLFGEISTDAIAVVTVFGMVLLVAHARGVDLIGAARSMPERLQGHPPSPDDATYATSGADLSEDARTGRYGGLPEGAIDLATLGSRPRMPVDSVLVDSVPVDTPPSDTPPSGGPAGRGQAGQPARGCGGGHRQGWSPMTFFTVLAACGVGAAMLTVAKGHPQPDAALIVAAPALAVVGLGLMLGGWFRVRGLATVATLLTLTLLTASAVVEAPRDLRYGDMEWRPTDAAVTHQEYKVGVGSGRLDLTALPVARGKRVTVDAWMGAGDLKVSVPSTVRVTLDAKVGLGDLSVDRHTISGPNAKSLRVLEPEGKATANPPEIVLRIRARIGDVRVTRG